MTDKTPTDDHGLAVFVRLHLEDVVVIRCAMESVVLAADAVGDDRDDRESLENLIAAMTRVEEGFAEAKMDLVGGEIDPGYTERVH